MIHTLRIMILSSYEVDLIDELSSVCLGAYPYNFLYGQIMKDPKWVLTSFLVDNIIGEA